MVIRLTLLAAILLTGCTGKMAIMGINPNGRIVERTINGMKYQKRLERALLDVSDSVNLALQEHQSNGGDEPEWKLRTIVVGVGLKADIDIGGFGLGISPKIRAAFGNGVKPPIP